MSPLAVSDRAVRAWGSGTAAIVRLLVASDDPLTGVAIARSVGVTQPRASQVLTQLAKYKAVRTTDDGFVGDRAVLLDLYARRTKVQLVEPESYWYSTRPLMVQARRLQDAAAEHAIALAFSADLAPDLTTPWRHPTVTIAYVSMVPPMDQAGLVPAEGRADASLIIRHTRDHTLLTVAPPWVSQIDGLAVADPVQQWRDLVDLGGEDRLEGADRLRSAILERALPRSP